MEFDGVQLDNDGLIVDNFKDYFSSVYSNYTVVPMIEMAERGASMVGAGCLILDQVTEQDVAFAIKKFKSKTTADPDLLPQYIFKGCADNLTPPLMFLFN
uniref:Uncharacterized protein n=1 Tax=Graphocephala atropunctata TaxID=36148 RepID=A0A1B6MPR2_9HEMI